jgi:hypothetical protein
MLLLPITDQDHRITLTDLETLGLKEYHGGFVGIVDGRRDLRKAPSAGVVKQGLHEVTAHLLAAKISRDADMQMALMAMKRLFAPNKYPAPIL